MSKPHETGTHAGMPLADAPWLQSPALRRVFDVLEADGGAARVVGGAVRNALLCRPITDIDIATPLEPSEVMARARAAGFGVHPTGIEHGTVTVVTDGHAFEVTTLRRDVETDGRRAVVAFSKDWAEDAGRRDFTMNALYVTRDGAVFDYFGGLKDLARRRVRFIGSAERRIREDYLRILRFFRFHAQYGEDGFDADGLNACVSLKDGLVRLSPERIGAEMMKLLAAPNAAPAVEVMAETSILYTVLGSKTYPGRFKRLIAIETAHGFAADALTRLAVLALDGPEAASHLGAHLRLSNAQALKLAEAARRSPAYDSRTPEADARAWLYHTGEHAFRPAALYDWASGGAQAADKERAERARLPERWHPPRFPITGSDVLAIGVPAGPRVGELLNKLEDWWIAAGFPGDRTLLREKLLTFAAGN